MALGSNAAVMAVSQDVFVRFSSRASDASMCCSVSCARASLVIAERPIATRKTIRILFIAAGASAKSGQSHCCPRRAQKRTTHQTGRFVLLCLSVRNYLEERSQARGYEPQARDATPCFTCGPPPEDAPR